MLTSSFGPQPRPATEHRNRGGALPVRPTTQRSSSTRAQMLRDARRQLMTGARAARETTFYSEQQGHPAGQPASQQRPGTSPVGQFGDAAENLTAAPRVGTTCSSLQAKDAPMRRPRGARAAERLFRGCAPVSLDGLAPSAEFGTEEPARLGEIPRPAAAAAGFSDVRKPVDTDDDAAQPSCSSSASGSEPGNGLVPVTAPTSRVLAEDRERHRKELDAAYRREKIASARAVELQQAVSRLQSRDAELRRQLTALRENAARRAIESEAHEVFGALAVSFAHATIRVAMKIAAREPAPRPPVKDSEVLRALRRAEQRALRLDRELQAVRGCPSDGSRPAAHVHTAAPRCGHPGANSRLHVGRPNTTTSTTGVAGAHSRTRHDGADDDDFSPIDPAVRHPVHNTTLDELVAAESADPTLPFRPLLVHR